MLLTAIHEANDRTVLYPAMHASSDTEAEQESQFVNSEQTAV
jgi:hypothetical protein